MFYSPDKNDQLLTLLQSIENELRAPPVVQRPHIASDIPFQSPRMRPAPPPPRAVSHPITPSQIQPNITAPQVHSSAPNPSQIANTVLSTANTVANVANAASNTAKTASSVANAISSLF